MALRPDRQARVVLLNHATPHLPVQGLSIRHAQGALINQRRSAITSALAVSSSLRMIATIATFAGFPAARSCVYLALRHGLKRMAATGPVPVNPADPGGMLERQALGALQGESGLEGRAGASPVDPIDGAGPEAQGSAPRLAGERARIVAIFAAMDAPDMKKTARWRGGVGKFFD